jgi:DNA polymerase I-like protein with 3'-5' exonuclease and polymerase domains
LQQEQELQDLEWIFKERPDKKEPMALDFETCGGDWSKPGTYPVGVSLSDSRGSLYIPFYEGSNTYSNVMHLLHQYQVPLLAHNVFFDAGWPLRDFGLWLNWKACTLAIYKLTATEGVPGFSWGLKSAQKDLLGWTETNEVALDNWLVQNGYVANVSKEPKEGYVFQPEGTEKEKEGARWLKPSKQDMWRAPVSILGHYAALDADACWQLFTYIFQPVFDKFQVLKSYILDMYPRYLELLIRQKLAGIKIDIPKLTQYQKDLEHEIAALQTSILTSPQIEPHILFWNTERINEVSRSEPAKFKKAPALGAEPPRYTKKGEPSKSWAQWDQKREALQERGPELSLNWVKWQERMQEAERTQYFNLGSGKQLAWLLYERLQFPVEIRTESGQPATDEDALMGMGEVGRQLIQLNEKNKLLQFCNQTLALTSKEGTIHPGFNVPGTLTGRLSGRDPNLQQVPKVGRFLECWIPRPGKVFLDCDHSALEPVVLAELSRDPGLWAVYGPDAPPNDVYLYLGANLPAPVGPAIRACGYVPEAPTKEAIQRAKKEAKQARQIAKSVKLACDYGASANKLREILKLQGIRITEQEAEAMWEAFWETYKGLRIWRRELEAQHRFNKGWVLNGIGRPLGVWEQSVKDLVNRVGQSTGHDIHIMYILIVDELLNQEDIPWTPVIVDFHDQMILEVDTRYADRVKWLMGVRAYEILNDRIQGQIKLKGEANIVENLAYAKVEGWGK